MDGERVTEANMRRKPKKGVGQGVLWTCPWCLNRGVFRKREEESPGWREREESPKGRRTDIGVKRKEKR
ncbi:hypothetical protein TNCV_2282851 [Trichonephila clavipes]|nr:hypothetical protein TNCV_2282851 [Trichonephila clavipes]